jgi:hypothetical protein
LSCYHYTHQQYWGPRCLHWFQMNFHNHADYVFSECIKLLGLIRSITYSFPSLECLYVLYFTLVRSRLEYAYVVWNCYHIHWCPYSRSLHPSVFIGLPSCSLWLYCCLGKIRSSFFTQEETLPWCPFFFFVQVLLWSQILHLPFIKC